MKPNFYEEKIIFLSKKKNKNLLYLSFLLVFIFMHDKGSRNTY